MKTINEALVKKFVELASDRLSGDWVVLGGSVLPLLGMEYRVTVDIDLAGPKSSKQEDLLTLMQIAEDLGLPPEAINQAGAFFLHKIKGWDKHLVLVHQGKKGRILRPDLILYLKLKMARLTESDLSDCLKMISSIKGRKPPDLAEVLPELKRRLSKESPHSERRKHLSVLLQALEKLRE